MSTEVLVVEDDRAMREWIVEDLNERGWNTVGAASATEAVNLVRSLQVQVLITDMNLAIESGIWLCRTVHQIDPDLPVIVITAFGSMEAVIEAIRSGAYDFLPKPFRAEQLALVVERAARLRNLKQEVATLRQGLLRQSQRSHLDGISPAMSHLRDYASLIANSDAPVLLTGESGSGKEQVAREIHDLSRRARKPFVAENVAAVPATLLESTLFGHVRGAFTGASAAREGLFRAADGGTFLLDEIGELALDLQAKLLRVLEDGRVRPVGDDQDYPVQVRVIAATHRDLAECVANGTFRADLYYRLAVLELYVPPLRERGRDILLLAQKFLLEEAEAAGKDVQGFHHTTASLLLAWRWPGNVRELRNTVQRAVVVARQSLVMPGDLPPRMTADAAPVPVLSGNATTILPLDAVERQHILHALEHCGGNKAEAARMLGIGRKTLYRKLEAWFPGIADDP